MALEAALTRCCSRFWTGPPDRPAIRAFEAGILVNRHRPEFEQVCGAAPSGAAAPFLNAVPYLSAGKWEKRGYSLGFTS